MMEELHEIFGSSSLPQVRGIAQFEITACAERGEERLCRRVTTRNQFEISGPPCPEQIKQMTENGEAGSLVHVHPLVMAHQVDSWRSTREELEVLLEDRQEAFTSDPEAVEEEDADLAPREWLGSTDEEEE